MKRASLIIASALMFAAPVAQAADMALKAPPPAPAVDPWAGWYLGVNIGGSWGRAADTTTYGAPPGLFAATSSHLDGVIGGGQVGYNWHSNSWLFGLEADIQGSGERSSATTSLTNTILVPINGVFFPINITGNLTDNERLSWFGTLRARLGLLASPTWLFSVTGGLAYGEIQNNETFTVGPVTVLNNFNNTRAGWTVGGGVEGVVSGNWTAKLEYLYMDFGTITHTYPGLSIFNPLTLSSHVTDNVVRVGLNYHFH